MKSILLKMLVDVLTSLPDVVSDIEQIVKEAESSDDAKQKVKAMINDIIKLLSALLSALG